MKFEGWFEFKSLVLKVYIYKKVNKETKREI